MAIALGSGLLMGLTPAPTTLWVFAWVALAPLIVLVHPGICRSSLRFKVLLCLLWGIGYHGLALSWIRDLHPLTWMGIPWLGSVAITLFAWSFITLWGAAIPVLWCLSLHLFYRRIPPSPPPPPLPLLLLSVSVWCLLETIWGWGPLYWTALAYTQSPHNLLILHLGQLSGPMAVTAALVAVNQLWAEAWIAAKDTTSGRVRRLLALNGALLIALHLVGFGLYSQPLRDVPETALKVGIVQGNVPTRIKLFEEGLQLSLQNYLQGYLRLADAGVDAVLMPEGALPWHWVDTPHQEQNRLYQAILQRGVMAWVGTVGTREGRITQTIFTITGDGRAFSRYDKVKLVPLGEYIPFEAVLGAVIDRLSPVGSSMLPGRADQTLDTPFGRAIAGICYESAFPELFRHQTQAGGQFILTASNNDPYGRGMMAQHHAQDLMRAIENDRWAARATNTGLSGIVDPHGKTEWLSGFRTGEAHAHTIYRRTTQTLYVRWGNWLTPVLLAIALGLWKTHQGQKTEDQQAKH